MASRQLNREFRKDLKKTGFARIKDVLHEKTKNKLTYNIQAIKNTPYVVDASNVHPGEDLKLKVKSKNGTLIANANHSHGSEDPHLTFNVNKNQNIKIIVQVEKDEHNSGKIPFNLAVHKYNKIPGAEFRTTAKRINQSFFSLKTDDDSVSENSVTTLWNQLTASSDDINIKDLDDLMGATISDGSTVSQDEISALSQVLQDLGNHVSSANLDYYSYIFGAAIGSNPANANYTGGTKSSKDIQKLGNLSVGFTSDQVELLQKKWFRGEDLPLAQIDGDSAAGIPPSTFDYALASGDLFEGTPSFQQLSQGDAGTCWFLSSLNTVANASTTSSNITSMFIDNEDGTYGVRFYGPQGSEEAWVTVNKELPVNNYYSDSLKMAGSQTSEKFYQNNYVKPRINLQSSGYGPANLTWAALAEKALAQVNETDLLKRSSNQNSYKAIEGGLSYGIDYVTGKPNYNSDFYDMPFSYFTELDPSQKPFLLGSFAEWSDSPDEMTQLVSGHAYSIVDKTLDETSKEYSFKVVNPWGTAAFGYDPTFMMPESELEKLFNNNSEPFVTLATTQ